MKRMKIKAGLPTTTIVIIAIVIMLVVVAVIYLALPAIEDAVNPDPCADTCYNYVPSDVKDRYVDCDQTNRYFIQWNDNGNWQYRDEREGILSPEFKTLAALRLNLQKAYENGVINEHSWHWIDCTAKAID